MKLWSQRLADKTLDEVIKKIKSGETTDLEEEKYGIVKATENAITLEKDTQVLYENIISIDVYKRDLMTTDLICLSFNFIEGKEELSLEIHEHMKGYKETIEKLPKYFPTIDQEWFTKVAFPAFETNLTRIWART